MLLCSCCCMKNIKSYFKSVSAWMWRFWEKKMIKNAFIFLLAFLKVPSQKWTVYSSHQSYSCAALTKYVKPVNHVMCFWIKLHPVQAIIFSRSVEGITWRRKPKGKAYLQYKFFLICNCHLKSSGNKHIRNNFVYVRLFCQSDVSNLEFKTLCEL